MPNPRGQQRDKPYREALRMELAAAGDDMKQLRAIARTHLALAEGGDMHAIKEMADRLDGKPAQESTITMRHDATDWSREELVAVLNNEADGSAGIAPANGRDRGPDSVH